MIVPEPLKTGDTVGLIAPSGPVDRDLVRSGIGYFEGLGLKVKTGAHLFEKKLYLAGDDRDRAQDLNNMFRDPDVKAIVCARGGYGALRIAGLIDLNVIRENPKLFIGYSDISLLLNFFYKRTGMVTFHGPMLGKIRDGDKPTLRVFEDFLFGEVRTYRYRTPELRVLKPGRAEGHLAGGCLSVIISTLGTDYEPLWDGAIFFFEDVDEPLYRIDRMLTQLKLSGRLDKVKGIIAGKMKGIKKEELAKVLKEILEGIEVPMVFNFPAGHLLPNLTLPIGASVILDAEGPSVTVNLR